MTEIRIYVIAMKKLDQEKKKRCLRAKYDDEKNIGLKSLDY
jgi:hypothetical protein